MKHAPTQVDRMEGLFPDMFRGWPRAMRPSLDLQSEIRIDVDETDQAYIVNAEIPGARKEDVHVSLDGNYVGISVDFKKDTEQDKGRTLLKETFRGSVSRGFTLGTDVDEKSADATLEDGVLRLTLPKRKGSPNHTLTIR